MKLTTLFLSLLFLLIINSCGEKKQENKPKNNLQSSYTKADSSSNLYVFENDEKRQILEIVYKSENEINFILKLVTKRTTCNITETGTAQLQNADGDPEMEEDENGMAFPIKEYICTKGKLKIVIRIDFEDKSKSIVLLDGYYTSCYPTSTEILKQFNWLMWKISNYCSMNKNVIFTKIP